jgi:hypothetical protein
MRLTPRVAGFRSEHPAGFKLECMAGFVGTRRETVYSCVVHNLTGIGACIELDSKIEQLPAAIAFSFDNFRTIHACKIVWREGHFAGIEFENPPELPQRRDVSRDAKLILAKPLQRA